MNRKMLLALVIIVALLVPVSACAPSAPAVEAEPPVQEEAAEPVVEEPAEVVEEEPAEEIISAEVVQLVDGFGREIEIEVPVSRIVSIAPSNVEVLFAIGAGDLVVGRDDTADFPEEALAVESIGGTWGELNTEAIVALEPDLVLGADLTSPEQIAQLEALDIPVFILGNPVDFDGLYDNLRTAGVITGHMDDAEALISALQERVAAVDEKVSGVETVSVFYEVDGTDPSAPWTVGAGTFHDYVITMAGGDNIAAGLEYYSTLSAEDIVTADPDVIVFGEGPWVPVTVESMGERPGWSTLSAVVNNRVYGIDTNWFDRPGPRLVDAYEALAAYLHPEAFE